MPYVLLALAAVMFGLYNVFIKLSADHIQAILGAVVLQFVAAFLGLGLLAYFKYTDQISLHVTPTWGDFSGAGGCCYRLSRNPYLYYLCPWCRCSCGQPCYCGRLFNCYYWRWLAIFT